MCVRDDCNVLRYSLAFRVCSLDPTKLIVVCMAVDDDFVALGFSNFSREIPEINSIYALVLVSKV